MKYRFLVTTQYEFEIDESEISPELGPDNTVEAFANETVAILREELDWLVRNEWISEPEFQSIATAFRPSFKGAE